MLRINSLPNYFYFYFYFVVIIFMTKFPIQLLGTAAPTIPPTNQPSSQPTFHPSSQPSLSPTKQPTVQPSRQPTALPSGQPTTSPTTQPTSQPTRYPSSQPTAQPTCRPLSFPSAQPTSQPSRRPTMPPSGQPSRQPTKQPLTSPTSQPSAQPTHCPTRQPTVQPTTQPTKQPTSQPSRQPTRRPFSQPTTQPTSKPSIYVIPFPTTQPSIQPTNQPTRQPTTHPTSEPSSQPSKQPFIKPTSQPSVQPTTRPSCRPISVPSRQPSSKPSKQPSTQPSRQPFVHPSSQPTKYPTSQPSAQPSGFPTEQPSQQPTLQPTAQPVAHPSTQPTHQPTVQPTRKPSLQPTNQPSTDPSRQPYSNPSAIPTGQPSAQPITHPTSQPTFQPTVQPSRQPSCQPTCQPSGSPTNQPSSEPSVQPTVQPSSQPLSHPTAHPTHQPTVQPSRNPTSQPTSQPSASPTIQPSMQPSGHPTRQPSFQPLVRPTSQPTHQPTTQPSRRPTRQPSSLPTSSPTMQPSSKPSGEPTIQPSSQPLVHPTSQPTHGPTSQPSRQPSCQPTSQPTSSPSIQPTLQPSIEPTMQPTFQPIAHPSSQPTHQPSLQPSQMPSGQPTDQPTNLPTSQPSARPSAIPTFQPSSDPSTSPTCGPSCQPSCSPSSLPSVSPSSAPTTIPSSQPTTSPSISPSNQPTNSPSGDPTTTPSIQPTIFPSSQPSVLPSISPSSFPSNIPSAQPSTSPSIAPSSQPSSSPTNLPSGYPSSFPSSQPSGFPTALPSMAPTANPSSSPSSYPSGSPSVYPTVLPSFQPSASPTSSPTNRPSSQPSTIPSGYPSSQPSGSPTHSPTNQPSVQPSSSPTSSPTYIPTRQPSRQPTSQPTGSPTYQPSSRPTRQPTAKPSVQPLSNPTSIPSLQPISSPSHSPTSMPTSQPSSFPTVKPTSQPSIQPSSSPTNKPTNHPSSNPSGRPSSQPTICPSVLPTTQPSAKPVAFPTLPPSSSPSCQPSSQPTLQPSFQPFEQPSSQPSSKPTRCPLSYPSSAPSVQPSQKPSSQPSGSPISKPTSAPSLQPTVQPTGRPTAQPSVHPTVQPTRQPSRQPSGQPSRQPLSRPTNQPSTQPSHSPSRQPSSQPLVHPSSQPSTSPASFPTSAPTWFVFSNLHIRNVTKTKQSIDLMVSLPINGHLYAMALASSASSSISVQTVIEKGRDIILMSSPSSGIEGPFAEKKVSFTGLQSASNYMIYFAAVLDRGLISPSKWMMSNTMNVTTSCCRSISLTQSSSLLVSGVDYEKVITVRVEGSPSSLMQIVLSMNQFADSAWTPLSSILMPSTLDIPVSVTSVTGSTYSVSLSRLEPGNYSVTATLVGVAAKDYEIVYSPTTTSLSNKVSFAGLPFVVQSADKPLPPPSLNTAAFSNDGSYITVTFTSNTNQAGSSSAMFKCDSLLSFRCAERSTCYWMSLSTIYAYVDTNDDCLTPGGMMSLSSSARVRAACPTSKCSSMNTWATTDVTQIIPVAEPAAAITPIVVVSLPDAIASCASLTLDVQSSTGSGGRSWRNATALVSVVEVDRDMDEETRAELDVTSLQLTRFLTESFHLEPPTTVSSSLLIPGSSYHFTVTLCNFLGKCGRGMKRVSVKSTIVPSVSISGSKTRSLTRNTALSLYSSASIPSCDGGGGSSGSRETLSYNWTVYAGVNSGSNDMSGLVYLSALRSTSNNPARFVLPAYSLSANSLYTVMITVTTSLSKQQASSSIQVSVGQGVIVAGIAGNKMRSVRKGETTFIDAGSGSYDEDILVSDSSNSLLFAWACMQTQPVLSSSCNALFIGLTDSFSTPSASSSKLSLTARDDIDTSAWGVGGDSADIVSQVTVTVYDRTKTRTSTTSLTVTILPSLAPVIALSSNIYRTKMNPSESLKLTGTISLPSGLASNVTWSLDESTSSLVNLATSALTPLAQFYQPTGSGSIGASLVKLTSYLALPTNVLPAGVTYSFILTCSLASPGKSASSLITVEVNKAPSPGLLLISPSTGGEELSTSFVFSCSRWVDDDLPLTYVFGYLSSSGQQVMLRSRSETSFSSNQLPAGQKRLVSASTSDSGEQQYRNMLIGIAQIYDSYLAATYVETSVEVKEKTTQLSTTDILSFVQNSTLSASTLASSSVDDIKQATALVMYLLNKVDCSQSPNCTALNRKSCSRTVNTCGECLSDKYLGDSGDANTLCYSPFALLGGSSGGSGGSSGGGLDSIVLVAEPKECPGNCSGHGDCMYTSIKTGKYVDDCKLNQLDCQAQCECFDDYSGEICSLSTLELEMKRKAREDVVNSLVRLTEIQDASTDATESMIATMVECSQKFEELSPTSMEALLTVSLATLKSDSKSASTSSSSSGAVSSGSSSGSSAAASASSSSSSSAAANKDSILSVVNNVGKATVASSSSKANRKRQLSSDSSSLIAKTAGMIDSVLQSYGRSVGESLVPSQDDVLSVKDTFRLAISAADKTSSSSGFVDDGNAATHFAMSMPRSLIEELLNIPVSQIALPVATQSDEDESSNFYYVVHQLSSTLQTWNESEYGGAFDSVSMTMPSAPCTGDDCRVHLQFPRSSDDTSYGVEINATIVSVVCVEGVEDSVPVPCPAVDGSSDAMSEAFVIQCNGTEATIEVTCPHVVPVAKCDAALAASSSAASSDDVDCQLIGEDEETITCACLFTDASSGRRMLLNTTIDTTISVSYVAMMTTTMSAVSATIVSAQGLDASVLKKGWLVLVTLGTFIGLVLFGLFYAKSLDMHEEDLHEYTQNRNELVKSAHPSATGTQTDASNTAVGTSSWKVMLSSLSRRLSSSVLITKQHRHRQHQIAPKPSHLKKQAGAGGLMSIAEEALPKILGNSKSLTTKVQEEMKRHHKWLGVMFFYCKRFPRMLRIMSLATNIIIMLFVQSITYNLSHGDDGSCDILHNETSCIEEPSAYQTGTSKCYWDSVNSECHYIQPENDAKVVVFIAILSAIVSTPFAVLTDWMIQSVLAAPILLPPTTPSQSEAIAASTNRRRSSAPVSVEKKRASVSSLALAPQQLTRPASVVRSNRTDDKKKDAKADLVATTAIIIQAGLEFQSLSRQLQGYREKNLQDSGSDGLRQEFDTLWGLDDSGAFLTEDVGDSAKVRPSDTHTDESKSWHRVMIDHVQSIVIATREIVTNLSEAIKVFIYGDEDDDESDRESSSKTESSSSGVIVDRIKVDLQQVIEHTNKEFDRFEYYQLSDREKSKRILFHFQKDLIAGLSGQALDSQDRREEILQKPYSMTMKRCCWFILIVMNACMLFYIFLFGISRDSHHQAAWAKSFAMWLIMEIFLVSSVMVLCMNVLMPMIMMKDVQKMKKKLVDTIVQYNRKLQQEKDNQPSQGVLIKTDTGKSSFNAAEYLFVSYRLAKAYPELRVSKIILAYETIWPRQSYLHVSADVTKTYSRKFAAIYQAITVLATYFLTTFLTVPIHIQDMIMQMLSTIVMGYTILIHLQLYHIYPVLIAIPAIVIAAIIHFWVKSNASQQKIEILSLLHYEKQQQQNDVIVRRDDGERKQQYERDSSFNDSLSSSSYEDVPFTMSLPVMSQTSGPVDRRASLQHGVGLLHQGKRHLEDNSIDKGDAITCDEDEGSLGGIFDVSDRSESERDYDEIRFNSLFEDDIDIVVEEKEQDDDDDNSLDLFNDENELRESSKYDQSIEQSDDRCEDDQTDSHNGHLWSLDPRRNLYEIEEDDEDVKEERKLHDDNNNDSK